MHTNAAAPAALAEEISVAFGAEPKKNKKKDKDANDSEMSLLGQRASPHELASGHKEKITFLIQTLLGRSNEESLSKLNSWLTTIRSAVPPDYAGQIANYG